MKTPHALFGLMFLLGLSACTTNTKEEVVEPVNWQQYQKYQNKLQHWTISGRISIQSEYKGGQADYTWQQHNISDYDIHLLAPMGAGTTHISGRQGGVMLTNSVGAEMYDTDVDTLMLRLNGWALPVSGLQFWVRGLPAPGNAHKVSQWNKKGLPQVMLQNGWRIEFRKYKPIAERLLPSKLFISRVEGEEVDVRLIIRKWILGVQHSQVVIQKKGVGHVEL